MPFLQFGPLSLDNLRDLVDGLVLQMPFEVSLRSKATLDLLVILLESSARRKSIQNVQSDVKAFCFHHLVEGIEELGQLIRPVFGVNQNV